MARYIGLDLGTTSITGLVLETESRRVLAKESVANETEVTSPKNQTKLRSGWDIDRMVQLAFNCYRPLSSGLERPLCLVWGSLDRCTEWYCWIRRGHRVHLLSDGRIDVAMNSFLADRHISPA